MRGSAALPALIGLACSEPASPPPPAPVEASQPEESLPGDQDLLEALGYLASEPAHLRRGVVHYEPARAQPGVNLYVSQHGQEARLLDMDGKELHRWNLPQATKQRRPGASRDSWWRTVHPLPDGGILAQTDNGPLRRLDRDSKQLWAFRDATHHDFDVRDDGHIFVLTRRRAHFPMLVGRIQEDFLVELDPGVRELRRVSLVQALIDAEQREILAELRAFQESQAPGTRDPLHNNTVEILDGSGSDQLPSFRRGNVLLSLPLIDRIAVLDFDAARIVWSLKGRFRHQHDPTLLPNGHILLFDNRGLGERSRVLEIDPVSGQDVWSYGGSDAEAFYSECCGRVYRLPNGNTLVVVSKSGRAFEITPTREIVWEFHSPHERDGKVFLLNDLLRLPSSDVPF